MKRRPFLFAVKKFVLAQHKEDSILTAQAMKELSVYPLSSLRLPFALAKLRPEILSAIRTNSLQSLYARWENEINSN